MAKILFVYPNKEGYPIIPLGISVISGVLKKFGHETGLFDVTFLVAKNFDQETRDRTGVVEKVDIEKHWKHRSADIFGEFKKKLLSFKPDLIAFSIVETNYSCAKGLFKVAKEVCPSIPIVVGGIFPTIASDFFVRDNNVDLICVGEGEYAMLELAKRIDVDQDVCDVCNLIVKKDSRIIRNQLAKFYNWEPLAFQDWSIFDDRHLIKPFMGRVRRVGCFELSRGCIYDCSYCVNKACQDVFKGLGPFHREKPIDHAIDELSYLTRLYSLDLVFFADENFLTISNKRLKEFCSKYKESIALPFYISTRADSINEERIRLLKDAGCVTLCIGVEHGNERIRTMLLNKRITDSVYVKAFEVCRKLKMRTTANIMVGLPYETEENILESVKFCRKLQPDSLTMAIFTPFYGIALRDICVKNGWMADTFYDGISLNATDVLKMPQISNEKIVEYHEKFVSLVFQQEDGVSGKS